MQPIVGKTAQSRPGLVNHERLHFSDPNIRAEVGESTFRGLSNPALIHFILLILVYEQVGGFDQCRTLCNEGTEWIELGLGSESGFRGTLVFRVTEV